MRTEILNVENIADVASMAHMLWPEETYAWMEEHYRSIMYDEHRRVFLMREPGIAIGFIELSTRVDYVEGSDGSPVAYVEGVFVREEFRCLGVGRKLVEVAGAWAKARGLQQLCSDTEWDNTSGLQFHLAAGFKEANRVICFVMDLT